MPLPRRVSPVMLAALAFVLGHLLLSVRYWYALPVLDGVAIGPADPDPWLRLTLVRDWLLSGDWYNHAVARTNAPIGGVLTPWTRPLDLVIAMLSALQPDTVELSLRLMRAALLLPWIWMKLVFPKIWHSKLTAGS